MRSQEDLEAKFASIKGYRAHLADVFADRQLLWALRAQCFQSAAARDYWLILVDGMDQAKWRLPRDPGLRSVSSLASVQRPQCVVEAVYFVNKRLDLYIMDKDQMHDASSIIHCIATTLERLFQEGERPPSGIINKGHPGNISWPTLVAVKLLL